MSATVEWERATTPLQEPPKISAERLHQAMQWALNSQTVPNNIKVAIGATMWFVSVDSFHDQEEEALLRNRYESRLDEHRCVLSRLIATGEGLVLAAKQNGILPEAPFKIEDLEATVESLHSAFHAVHRNANTQNVNADIAKLFPDEEPKA